MTINRYKGDAAKKTQWLRLSAPAVTGGVLGVKIGSKVMTFPSWNVTNMVSKLNGRTDPVDLVSESGEFQDVEFTAGTDGTNPVIECKARTPGEPFDLTTYLGGDSFLNEIEQITLTNNPTGGTFTLTFQGQTTGNIAYNASAGTIQTALEALSNIAPGDVTVTGSSPTWLVEFSGAYEGVNVDQMTGDKANLTGGGCTITVTANSDGVVPVNEVQTIAFDGVPDGGTFTLTYNGATTGNIAWDASAATVQTALRALSTINGANVTCSGGALPGSPITVTFGGTLAGLNVPLITGNGTSLTTSNSIDYTMTVTQAAVAGVNQKINVKWNTSASQYAGWVGSGRILMSASDTAVSGLTPTYNLKTATQAQWQEYFDHTYNESGTTPFWGSDNVVVTGVPQDPGGMTLEFVNGLKYKPCLINFDAFTGAQYSAIVQITYPQTASYGTNEKQRFTLNADRTSDMFFHFDGVTVGPWATTATISTIINDIYLAFKTKNDERQYTGSAIDLWTWHSAGAPGDQHITLSGSFMEFEFRFHGYQGTDVADASLSAAPIGGFHVLTDTTTQGDPGTNELQIVSLTSSEPVFGGTFTLTQNGNTTGNLDWDATAAEIQAELEGLTGIGAGNVSCAGSLPNGVTCIFAKSLGNLALMTGTSSLNCGNVAITTTRGGVPYTPIGITVIQESEGPEHFDVDDNWTLGRIPHWGDTIVMDSGDTSIRFGTKQSTEFVFFRYSLSHSQFVTASGRRVHKDGQKVRVRALAGATLPTGLAADTDYLIDSSDWFGNFELTDTGGTTISCSDDGDGSWVVETFLNVEAKQSWNGGLGLPDLNEDNQNSYVEYRQTKLECQLGTVNVGEGTGSGPTRFRIKALGRILTCTIHNNGARTAEGDPGITIETEHFDNVVNLFKGSIGIAQKDDQFAWIKTLRVGYVDNVTSDVTLILGPNVVLDTSQWLEVSGGTIHAQCLLPKLKLADGEIHALEGGITTIEADKGTIYYLAAETCTTAKIGSGCSINFTKDMRPRTFTNIYLYENSEFHDPFGTVIMTNGYNLVRCGENDCVIELPPNVNIVRTPL